MWLREAESRLYRAELREDSARPAGAVEAGVTLPAGWMPHAPVTSGY